MKLKIELISNKKGVINLIKDKLRLPLGDSAIKRDAWQNALIV